MFRLTARVCHTSWRLAIFAAFALLALASVGAAHAETRYLKFYHLHTHETGVFAYKVNGRYVPSELKKINYILRDWRKNQAVTMDPQLLDLIWEAYRQSGSNGYINVICGCRSPATNSMLRSRSSGVAKESQHTFGKALDFSIAGVPLKKMREIGLRMQVGGVGYYPTSGSPFVHFDVGRARHWPRMSRSQLLAVFPNGNTVHVPSDGRPLPGYQQALASYKQRRGAADIQFANAGGRSSGGSQTLLSFLFGGGSDEAADESDAEVAPAVTPARAAPVQRQAPVLAKAAPEPEIAIAAVIPQSRRNIARGVALPVPDVFDTSRSKSALQEAKSKLKVDTEAQTQMAMLEPARVPFPTFAPSRQAVASPPLQSGAGASTSADPVDVSSLVSDLQTSDERAKQKPAGGEQLAYAIPTPRDRPEYDAPLDHAATLPNVRSAAAATVSSTRNGLLAAFANAATPIDRRGITRAVETAQVAAPASDRNLMTEASFKSDVRSKSRPSQSTFAAVLESSASVSNGGKGGRVIGAKKASSYNRGAVASADLQDIISTRIEMASLMADPASPATSFKTSAPETARLVVKEPDATFAGNVSSLNVRERANRFAAASVTSTPVIKIKP